MLAVRLPAIGAAPVLVNVPIPVPAGSEVRVRVAGCGVCRTDLHIVRGEQPRVSPPVTLGHEIAGWIDAYGPSVTAAPLELGTPVVVYGGWGCGSCAECAAGEEQRCALGRSPGFQADGGYATYVLVPSTRYLVPIGSLDPVRAAPLADAGVTPYRAVRRAQPWLGPGARVLIIGFGALGQFALQYLRRLDGLVVTVHDLDPAKLALARSLGFAAGVDDSGASNTTGGGTSVAPDAQEASKPTGDGASVSVDASEASVDVVFDFVGTDATLAQAAATVSPGGLIAIVGEGGGTLPVSFESPAIEVTVTTTAWGSLDDLRAVVALAPELDWTVDPMPLTQAHKALDELAAGTVSGRIVLVPGPDGIAKGQMPF
jgi:propanol-preferring alcohol dehydrogenase